ncbi:MAG TPA: CDGSH iron-sulfur domain-containing protein [archaeon]|nr:CDGSH iron-sulfur domain-containing protein [archaeon]
MPRIVKKTDKGPIAIAIGKETKWFCRCDLSRNQPFCDGSHALTQTEDDDKLYMYDENRQRHEVKKVETD